MKIGFLVNDIAAQRQYYTTPMLALTAVHRKHDVWFINAGDLIYDMDETIHAWGWRAKEHHYRTPATYLKALQNGDGNPQRIDLSELDILMIRVDPTKESNYHAWVKHAGIIFGEMLLRSGVIVLNDPTALAGALDKMYLQLMPQKIRPQTLISRDREALKDFIADRGGTAVLKGFQGIDSQAVFVVTPDNRANLNQMIDAITRYGYAIAQEYLPGAEHGSVRMFFANGEPLRHKGKVAAFQWTRTSENMRLNIHDPGSSQPIELQPAHFEIAEALRPRLVQDGVFLAGIEIIDDKLIDIDIFCPGGLVTAQGYAKANFGVAIIAALEKKVEYMSYYHRQFDNIHMATL